MRRAIICLFVLVSLLSCDANESATKMVVFDSSPILFISNDRFQFAVTNRENFDIEGLISIHFFDEYDKEIAVGLVNDMFPPMLGINNYFPKNVLTPCDGRIIFDTNIEKPKNLSNMKYKINIENETVNIFWDFNKFCSYYHSSHEKYAYPTVDIKVIASEITNYVNSDDDDIIDLIEINSRVLYFGNHIINRIFPIVIIRNQDGIIMRMENCTVMGYPMRLQAGETESFSCNIYNCVGCQRSIINIDWAIRGLINCQ